MTKSHSWAFYFKCFHNYNFFSPHVYQFHALIYGLKFILELKWPFHKLITLILKIHD
jgi:hypothetical protein